MNILFIHQAFPAQFGQLALELHRRYGWTCRFLVEHLSVCPAPSPEMIQAVEIRTIPGAEHRKQGGPLPWPQVYGQWIELCQAVSTAVRELPGPEPDLIVAHGGQGAPTLFLPDHVSCPIINYCEYYFAPRFQDLTYRVDPWVEEVAPFYPRCINAPSLMGLTACASGYSPTKFQRDSFPSRYHDRIEVLFDGVDTNLYRPGRNPERRIGPHRIDPDRKIVTFVARGLESMRGFDIFAQVAAQVARDQPDVLFVVAGSDEIYYGWDNHFLKKQTFREWALQKADVSPDRFLFLGHLPPDQLADLLAISQAHLYLSVPFAVSWSLFNALSSGCVVIASENESTSELISNSCNGCLKPMFDVEALAERTLSVLNYPDTFAEYGKAARERIEAKYSLDVCIPRLKEYFERIASRES